MGKVNFIQDTALSIFVKYPSFIYIQLIVIYAICMGNLKEEMKKIYV